MGKPVECKFAYCLCFRPAASAFFSFCN